MKRILFMLWLMLVSATSLANDKAKSPESQSYESCGLISSEYLTVLQLAARGFDANTLKKSLPDISDRAQERIDALLRMTDRDGFIDTYSTVNSEYARCAKQVYDNRALPPKGSREAHFHRCAGENKISYEILLSAMIGAEKTEVLGQLRPQHQQLANAIFDMYQSEGALAVFDGLASELKHCLRKI